jgi:hypothetical protein
MLTKPCASSSRNCGFPLPYYQRYRNTSLDQARLYYPIYMYSIYMGFGRIILLVDGEVHSLVKKKWLTKLFVSGDVLSFLVQSIGMMPQPHSTLVTIADLRRKQAHQSSHSKVQTLRIWERRSSWSAWDFKWCFSDSSFSTLSISGSVCARHQRPTPTICHGRNTPQPCLPQVA